MAHLNHILQPALVDTFIIANFRFIYGKNVLLLRSNEEFAK